DKLHISGVTRDSTRTDSQSWDIGDSTQTLMDCSNMDNAESWSSSVDHKFYRKQDKKCVKRQDVIYELMQTEIHHLQTLHVMAEVFRRGVKEEVQLDADAVERLFPCLDQLLLFHHGFFSAMKERRQNSQSQGQNNYLIQRIGDVLLQQFSDENGKRMTHLYGEFCSHHMEAVRFFKELQLNNKKFQNFIKVKYSRNNYLVRRREIPECILLVTQRITKYPVLLERILQYTQSRFYAALCWMNFYINSSAFITVSLFFSWHRGA
uniref:DH domain-containing protein n=1 Tax=Periophthalmus magnuspinnatus TaxID=409849 RepID=A0A3B4AU82_9GOBI